MYKFKTIINNLSETKKIVLYNVKLFKYHLYDPDPGTFWYCLRYWIDTSYSYFVLKAFIYFIGVLCTFFIFIIYRFIKEHESLVLFIYIVWFCSSLFYIEFIMI